MKRSLKFIISLTTVILLGSTSVSAASYWERFFQEEQFESYYLKYGQSGDSWISEWKDLEKKLVLESHGLGDDGNMKFKAYKGTNNIVLTNVSGITIASSKENVLTGSARVYEFTEEKESYNEYVTNFEAIDFAGFQENYCVPTYISEQEYYAEDLEEKAILYCKEKYSEKPTWWEFNGYESNPDTWWKAYGLSKEPTSAYEIVPTIKGLGKADLTVQATDKESIQIHWQITAKDFVGAISADGLLEILNDVENYQEGIESYTEGIFTYHFALEESNAKFDEVMAALKGKDLTILTGGDSYYTINGKDFENLPSDFTFKHKISIDEAVNKEQMATLLTGKEPLLYIDFESHGNLNRPFTMSLFLSNYVYDLYEKDFKCEEKSGEEQNNCYGELDKKVEEYLNDATFSLLYYNEEKNEMEIMNDNITITGYNQVNLSFAHFSSFVLVKNEKKEVVDDKKSPQTGDNILVSVTIGVISLVGLGFALKLKKEN